MTFLNSIFTKTAKIVKAVVNSISIAEFGDKLANIADNTKLEDYVDDGAELLGSSVTDALGGTLKSFFNRFDIEHETVKWVTEKTWHTYWFDDMARRFKDSRFIKLDYGFEHQIAYSVVSKTVKYAPWAISNAMDLYQITSDAYYHGITSKEFAKDAWEITSDNVLDLTIATAYPIIIGGVAANPMISVPAYLATAVACHYAKNTYVTPMVTEGIEQTIASFYADNNSVATTTNAISPEEHNTYAETNLVLVQ